jgi:phospholipid-binding lipoprotein MlaA
MARKSQFVLPLVLPAALIMFSLSGCASKAKAPNPKDPYENLNRHTYALNKGLDRAVLKPLAKVYSTITPGPLQKGVHNAYNNIGELPTIANGLLQGKFYQATSDTWRFAINTTIGILGFVDVASKMDLPRHEEDFGLTLARWGYKSSNYLVLPLFGPRTVRDTLGIPVDRFVFTSYQLIPNVPVRNSIYGFSFVDNRASLMTAENVMRQAALDPYQFQRDAYLQWREHKIKESTPGWSVQQELDQDKREQEKFGSYK